MKIDFEKSKLDPTDIVWQGVMSERGKLQNTATILINGQKYFLGGITPSFPTIEDAEIYAMTLNDTFRQRGINAKALNGVKDDDTDRGYVKDDTVVTIWQLLVGGADVFENFINSDELNLGGIE